MMRGILCLVLALALTTTSAFASTQGLKAAFDELNYALNIEWDQKDEDFYKNEMKKFQQTVSSLKAQGLTEGEMLNIVLSEVKDQRAAESIKAAFDTISIDQMNASDAISILLETMKKTYSSGASWNGDSSYIIFSTVVVIALIAIIINHDEKTSETYCYNDYYAGTICVKHYR